MREVTVQEKSTANSLFSKFKKRKFGILKTGNIIGYSSLLLIVILVSCAIVPQWIAPYPPTKMFSDQILQAPSMQHLFGTDYFGTRCI